MGLLIALDHAGLHYVFATIISGFVLIPLSYALHVRITYRVVEKRDSFVRYAAAQAVNTPVALVLFFFIRGRADVPMVWAAPAVMGLMFLYNITSSFWAIVLRSHSRTSSII
jgi:putative flippase GtrA